METSLQNREINFHQLSDDLDNLLNKEELLIRSEFQEKTRDVKLSEFSYYACGIALLVGVLAMAVSLFFLLAIYVQYWKAAFAIGLLFLSCAGFIYGAAKEKLQKAALAPERSLNALNEMKVSLHEKMNEITRH